MAINSYFFNAVESGNTYDRTYTAEDFCNYLEQLVGNGVFADPSTTLQVRQGSGMTVIVGAGQGWINGHKMINTADMELTLDTSDVVLSRIDRIIFYVDHSSRTMGIEVKKGTPATSPTAPALTRNNTRYELGLATILVGRQVTEITNANITDTRPDNDVCGYVTGLIEQLDLTNAFLQYQTASEEDREKNQTEFDEWFSTVKETLATSTLIRSYYSTYTTSAENESVIPIDIPQFNKELDILQVYINGLKLIPNVEYTLNSNEQITLTLPVNTGTQISFEVFKSIDGSDAETVVQQVYELQTLLDATKITGDTGNMKLSVTDTTADILTAFIGMGIGFHTLYAASGVQGLPKTGAYRLFGHRTDNNAAYLYAMQADGSVYSNYYNAGTWRGWNVLYEVTPSLLYQSENGSFPNADIEITPTKPLSDCQHGWTLTFTGYDDESKEAKDYYVQTVYIPKRSYKGTQWNGESMTFALVYSYTESSDTNLQCTKTFTVYDDKIVSSSYNSQGVSRNMVLRSIQEY